jgi:hypothetical protein
MSWKRPSTASLHALIALFEQSHPPILSGNGQRVHGVPGWDFLRSTSLSTTELSTWTQCIGYAGHYPAECGDERVPVALTEDNDPLRYGYRCPITFRRRTLPAREVAIYSVATSLLLHAIADLLDIPHALRKGIAAPVIEGVLWHLGKTRIGHARTDVWVVRGLASSVNEVFAHMYSPLLPDHGLVLSSGIALPDIVRPPRHYRFASIREVIIDYLPTPQFDIELLQRLLCAPGNGTHQPMLPVQYDAIRQTLTIRGKSKPWHIKGAHQAAAVKYMFEQFQHGRRWVMAAEILAATFPDKHSNQRRRLQNLFRGNAQWREYITQPQKGRYGFQLDG